MHNNGCQTGNLISEIVEIFAVYDVILTLFVCMNKFKFND